MQWRRRHYIMVFRLYWKQAGDRQNMIIRQLNIKNSGESYAGMITAGKFLSHFTSEYPFIHLDIAGVAFNEKKKSYMGYGGTGFGIRLMIKFIEKYFIQK